MEATSLRVLVLRLHAFLAVLACTALAPGAPYASALHAQEAPDKPVVRIAFLVDDITPLAKDIRTLVQEELLALTRDDFDVRFPEDLVTTADGSDDDIVQALERLTAREDVALIVAQGFRASEVAARRVPWPKPVIASTVFDARFQGLPETRGASGVANLTYIALPEPGPLVRDLSKFRTLASFSTVAILFDEQATETFTAFLEPLRNAVADLGIAVEAMPAGPTAASNLERLPAGADAVYVTPFTHMSPGELERFAEGLASRRVPSFSWSSEDVARGIMASLGNNDLPLLARRIALNAYRALLGDDLSTLPVTLAPTEELVMNMRTVRNTGVHPPLETLLEARRLFETPEGVRRNVTLKSALEEALAANLTLAVEDQAVRAGAEEIRLARANLLPDFEAGLTGATIAKSVAEASFGQRPQHTVDGGLTLRQLIFSQEANANVSIQKSIQTSRERDRASLELDVAMDAAEAYLNVLRAKTLEQVQQYNLDLTLASLRLAGERERIGAAGPGERLRLQSELARRRADRIDAFAMRSTAEVSLNQVLNRPLDEQFLTPEANLEGRALLEETLATGYLANIDQMAVLSDFLVDEAMRLAPEIQSLDAAIAAQERLLASTRQAFYLPTVALQGNVSTHVLQEGAGASASAPPGLPSNDVTNYPWNAGLSITLPLFQGSSRFARREQTSATLTRLQLQRELAAQRIEQNVRVRLLFARSSLAIVNERETAAETARRSLKLVTEAYGQGVASVVDLLEAQTSALLSERGVTNAIYDYLINLKWVERAVGQFEALATPEERADFVRRLETYMQTREDES